MSSVTRIVNTTPDRVWEVLSDGWLFPLWVVGAARIRDVDETWPEVGSRIHHSVGVWPALINDDTEVLEQQPSRLIRLEASAWPLGKAHVAITLNATGSHTEVVIDEQATSGPGAVVPDALIAPVLNWRNVETLRRLALIAEKRPSQQSVEQELSMRALTWPLSGIGLGSSGRWRPRRSGMNAARAALAHARFSLRARRPSANRDAARANRT